MPTFFVPALLAAALLGAGAAPLAARARTVAYVSSTDARTISVLELDEASGALKVIQVVTVSGDVMPLAVSPDRAHLYASLRSKPFSVASFAIDPASGTLTPRGTAPLAADMAYLSTDGTGRFLFASSYFGDEISVNAIRPDGGVAPKPLAVIPTGKHAHCILADPSNAFVFVTNLGEDAILQYRFDASRGALAPNTPPAVRTQGGAGPRHLAFHPRLPVLFEVNELDATVDTFTMSASGTLTLLASVSVLPEGFEGRPWAADVHVTPDGRFLYASERTSSTIAVFRIDGDDGSLTRTGTRPTEAQPRAFGVDPSGRYLIAAGQRSNAVAVYAIDRATGALRPVSRLAVGKNPSWVSIVALPAPAAR